MASILKVNGFDFTPYLPESGYTLIRNDVDSEDSGELADGTFRRDRVIIRYNIKFTIDSRTNFITDYIKKQMLTALYPQWVTVEFNDQVDGSLRSNKFYTSTVETTLITKRNGRNRWAIGEINLVGKGVAGEGQSRLQ